MEELPCATILYRAIRPSWVPDGKLLAAAFLRRGDEDGLSANTHSPLAGFRSLKKCSGVASLHVGRIRDLGLEVRADPDPNDISPESKYHVLIINLPTQAEDPARAEKLAGELVMQSRFIEKERIQTDAEA